MFALRRRSSRHRRTTGAAPSRPHPSSEFFTSTNVPTFDFSASRASGRRYAYGPTLAPGPISAPTAWLRSTVAPARTTVSTSVTSGPHHRAAADHRAAAQLGVLVHHRVPVQGHRHVDPRRGRVEQAHPGAHPALVDPVPQQPAQRRQLHPVVAAERLGVVGRQVHRHRLTGRDQQTEHVGQVLLALVVVRGELAQHLPQPHRVERVDARVDLTDRQLLRAGVALLDDLLAVDPRRPARSGRARPDPAPARPARSPPRPRPRAPRPAR